MGSIYRIIRPSVSTKTFAEANVSGATLDTVNMGADILTLMFDVPYTTDLRSIIGVQNESLSITKDGVQIFCGYRGNQGAKLGATSRGRSVKIYNAWGMLERTPYSEAAGYFNDSTSSWPIANYGSGDVSALVSALLARLQTNGYLLTGTVDLPAQNVNVGPIENQSYAGVIRALLRTVPDAVVTFDYNTGSLVPRVHVLAPTGTTMVNFPLLTTYAANIADGEWEDLGSDAVTGVTVDHVVPYSEKRTSYAPNFTANTDGKTELPVDWKYKVLRDSVGALGTPGSIYQTEALDGSFTSDVISYTFPTSLSQSLAHYLTFRSSPHPRYPNVYQLIKPQRWADLLAKYPWLATGYANSIYATKDGDGGYISTPVVGAAYFDASLLGKTDRLVIMPHSEWDEVSPQAELLRQPDYNTSDSFEMTDISMTIKFEMINTPSIFITEQVNRRFLSTYEVGSNVWRGGKTYTRRIVTSSGTLTATAGMAQKVYDQASVVRAGGFVKLDNKGDPIFVGATARKVAVPSSATAIIQRVGYDLFRGTTNLTIGPPGHLRPSDSRNILKG